MTILVEPPLMRGNTGKITEVYARDCKEIVILEPKHALVEYSRTYRPHIKFVGGVEIYLYQANTLTGL